MARDPLSALTQAVESVESGGRRYGPGGGLLTSPRGAMGEMQVMPGTARDPGFGVKPARSGDPEDLARVGRDYLSAMVGRYGDVDRALVAYNWGPGNADRWLKEGADPAKLPKETADYLQRVRSKLPAGFSLAAAQPEQVQQVEASVDEPTPAEQLAAAPEPRTEDRGTIPTQRLTQSYGPGYQAALAVSFLADEKEGEKALPTEDSEAEKLVAASAGRTARSTLADLDLSYQSPFDQPVRMASGGLALRPSVYLPPAQQKKLEAARMDLENYSSAVDAYNKAAQEWNTQVYAPYEAEYNKYNTEREKYINEVYYPYKNAVDLYNASLQAEIDMFYNPYVSQVEAYNKAVDEWNAGPRTTDFTMRPPDPLPSFVFTSEPPKEPAPFSLTAPVAPDPFSMASPTAPSVSPEQYMAMQEQAKKKISATKTAFDVLSDPSKYNLSLNRMFAEGGEVAQDPEMPPDQAIFGRYPSSGIGRPQSEYSEALQSGSAAREMLRGMTLAPQYLLGAPVDLATMAMRPFGYSEKEPVGGSEWLIRKSREMGIAPKEPESRPEKLAFGAGEIAGQLVSPVAATETAVRGAGRLAERTGEAARMLMQATEGGPRPVPGGFGAAQRGAVDVGGKKGPIYQETPTPESPFVSKLDTFVANMPGAVRKEQFLNSLKGKFKAHEIQRAEEVLSDVPSDAKLTQSDLLNRLKSKYDPAGYAIEVRPPKDTGVYYQWMDNVYKDKPLGVINLYEKPSIKQKQIDEMMKNTSSSVIALNSTQYTPSPSGVKALSNMPDGFKSFIKEKDPTAYKLLNRFNKKLESYLDDVIEKSYVDANGEQASYYSLKLLTGGNSDRLYFSRAYNDPTEETDRIFQKYIKDNNIKAEDIADKYDRIRLYRKVIEEDDARQARDLVSSLEKEYPPLKKIGYRPEVNKLDGGKIDEGTDKTYRGAFLQEYSKLISARHDGMKNDAKMLYGFLLPLEQDYKKYLKTAYKNEMPYQSQHSGMTPYGSVSFSRFSEHEAQVPGYGNLKGIYLNELQSDRLDDVRKGTSGAKEAFKGMKDQPQTTQQLMIKSAIAAALQRGDNFVAFPGAESAQRQLYEKLPRNLNEVVKDLGPGFEVRPIELSNAEGQVFTHPAVIIDPFPSKSRLFNRPTPDQLLNRGIPFADGGEVKRKRRGKKSQPAPDTSMSRRSLDEYLQQEGWRNPRPFDADTLEYAQQLAQRNPDYGDMLKYLEMRGARPEASFVPMRGDRANYRAYFEAPDAEGRDPGSLGINRDYQYGDPRRVVPALIHETTHAADRQMRTQYGERAPKSEARRMFEEAYKKFGREEMAKRLDPEWAKKYSGYRASERELPAQAMGNLVQYDPRAVNEPVEAYNTPTHLDPTMATEFLIMQDLARRAQEASQQPAP